MKRSAKLSWILMGQGSARYNSITNKEKEQITDSWMIIRVHLPDFGLGLFTHLINTYPHIAKYWPIGSEFSVKHFAEQFIIEFDRFVLHLYRPTQMKVLLMNNAVKHAPRGISPADFNRLRKAIVATISDKMAPSAEHNEILLAWSKVIGICFSFLTEMAEDHLDEQKRTAKTNVVNI